MSKTKGDFFDKIKESTLEMFEENPNPQPQYLPDMMRALSDVNTNKRTIEEIDWECELAHTITFLNTTRTITPIVIWLWGLITLIDSPVKRIDVLKKLQNHFHLFNDAELNDEFLSAIRSLIAINLRVKEFNQCNKRKVVHFWNDKERKSLNDLSHFLDDDFVNAKDLFSIATSIGNECYVADDYHYLYTVLRAFDDNLQFKDEKITDFCYDLCEANKYRRLIVEGHTDDEKLESESDYIPLLLRNDCFDLYIQKRIAIIEKELNADKKRIKLANKLECMERLLMLERTNLVREGISEYDDEDMTVVFVKYLQMKVDELKGPEPQNSTHQVIINAPVGQFIANVEQMNTTSDK